MYDFLVFLFWGFLRVASFNEWFVISTKTLFLSLSRWVVEGLLNQMYLEFILEAQHNGPTKKKCYLLFQGATIGRCKCFFSSAQMYKEKTKNDRMKISLVRRGRI